MPLLSKKNLKTFSGQAHKNVRIGLLVVVPTGIITWAYLFIPTPGTSFRNNFWTLLPGLQNFTEMQSGFLGLSLQKISITAV